MTIILRTTNEAMNSRHIPMKVDKDEIDLEHSNTNTKGSLHPR